MNLITETFKNNANNWSVFKDEYGSFQINKGKATFEYFKENYSHWVTLNVHIPFPSYIITSEIESIFKSTNSSYGIVFDAENLTDFLVYQVYPETGFFQICHYQNGNWSRLDINYPSIRLKPNVRHKLQVYYLLAGGDAAIVRCYFDSILTNQITYEIPPNKYFRSVGFLVSESKIFINNLNFNNIDQLTTYVAIHTSSSN